MRYKRGSHRLPFSDYSIVGDLKCAFEVQTPNNRVEDSIPLINWKRD